MSQPLVELRHVDRSFKQGRVMIPVLKDINLTIAPNEIVCLVGESGCGKTTTGKIIVGLLGQSAGDVLYRGAGGRLPKERRPTESVADRSIGSVRLAELGAPSARSSATRSSAQDGRQLRRAAPHLGAAHPRT